MKKTSIFITSTAILMAGSAVADDATGWYIGADVGATQSSIGNENLVSPNVCSFGGISCSTDNSGNSWQLRGGYKINEHVAIEGAYTDLGKSKASVAVGPVNITGEQKTKAISVSAIGKVPLDQAHRWKAYGKVGVAAWDSDIKMAANVAIPPPLNTSSSKSGTSPVIGAGVEYDLSKKVSLRAGWDRYQRVGERAQAVEIIPTPNLRTIDADVDNFSIGATFNF